MTTPDHWNIPREDSGTPPAADDLVILVPSTAGAAPKSRSLQEVGDTFPPIPVYSTAVAYSTNQPVIHEFHLYIAGADIAAGGILPGAAGSLWHTVAPAAFIRGRWRVGVAYGVSDVVVFLDRFYSSRVAHTSTAANAPDVSAATWSSLTPSITPHGAQLEPASEGVMEALTLAGTRGWNVRDGSVEEWAREGGDDVPWDRVDHSEIDGTLADLNTGTQPAIFTGSGSSRLVIARAATTRNGPRSGQMSQVLTANLAPLQNVRSRFIMVASVGLGYIENLNHAIDTKWQWRQNSGTWADVSAWVQNLYWHSQEAEEDNAFFTVADSFVPTSDLTLADGIHFRLLMRKTGGSATGGTSAENRTLICVEFPPALGPRGPAGAPGTSGQTADQVLAALGGAVLPTLAATSRGKYLRQNVDDETWDLEDPMEDQTLGVRRSATEAGYALDGSIAGGLIPVADPAPLDGFPDGLAGVMLPGDKAKLDLYPDAPLPVLSAAQVDGRIVVWGRAGSTVLVPAARLATGVRTGRKFLRDDQVWASIPQYRRLHSTEFPYEAGDLAEVQGSVWMSKISQQGAFAAANWTRVGNLTDTEFATEVGADIVDLVRGAWTVGQSVKTGELWHHENTLYVARRDHTATTGTAPPASSYWRSVFTPAAELPTGGDVGEHLYWDTGGPRWIDGINRSSVFQTRGDAKNSSNQPLWQAVRPVSDLSAPDRTVADIATAGSMVSFSMQAGGQQHHGLEYVWQRWPDDVTTQLGENSYQQVGTWGPAGHVNLIFPEWQSDAWQPTRRVIKASRTSAGVLLLLQDPAVVPMTNFRVFRAQGMISRGV